MWSDPKTWLIQEQTPATDQDVEQMIRNIFPGDDWGAHLMISLLRDLYAVERQTQDVPEAWISTMKQFIEIAKPILMREDDV